MQRFTSIYLNKQKNCIASDQVRLLYTGGKIFFFVTFCSEIYELYEMLTIVVDSIYYVSM